MSQSPNITKENNGTVTISGTISAETVAQKESLAIKNLNKSIKVDGFRPGKATKEMLIKKIGELALWEEMAKLAVSDYYLEAIKANQIDAIGYPTFSFTKLAPNNPIEFSINTAVMPEIKLPDYKKIAQTHNKKFSLPEATEQEVDDAITQLRRFRTQATLDQAKAEQAKANNEKFIPTKLEDIKDEELVDLNMGYLSTLGNFKDMDDFKTKLKENITQEKQARAKENLKIAIVEEIVEKSEFSIPDILINYEVNRSLAQLDYDLARNGLKMEDYLRQIKKTQAEVEQDLRPNAEKTTKIKLVIANIAKAEDLKTDPDKVTVEVNHILETYKDSPDKNEDHIRAYVEEVLLSQAVFEFLTTL